MIRRSGQAHLAEPADHVSARLPEDADLAVL